MIRDGIYLYGYYGQGNLGDDLLMAAAVRMIRAIRPDAPILVHCHDPARLPDIGDHRLIPVPASAALAQTGLSRFGRLRRYIGMLREAFSQCDTLVFGGGTIFQDSNSPTSIMIIAGTAALAKRMGISVIAIGAGVGDLKTTLGKLAFRQVLRTVRTICVRDEASLNICNRQFNSTHPRLTADLAYALEIPPSSQARRSGLAFSIQPAVTRRDDDTGRRSRDALRAVIKASIAASEPCLLLAFETKRDGQSGLDDTQAWKDVLGDMLVEDAGMIRLKTLEGSLNDALSLMGTVKAHYGMRYHGHVLAAMAGTPFAGLSHDIKVREVCRSLHMPCQDVEVAEPGQAILDIQRAEAAKPDLQALQHLIAASKLNFVALQEVLGGPE